MTDLQLIDRSDLESFKEEILAGVRKLLEDHARVTAKKTKVDKSLDEIDTYVIFKEALRLLGISDDTWTRKHRQVIKWKKDGNKIWVHLPSIEQYLKQDNING